MRYPSSASASVVLGLLGMSVAFGCQPKTNVIAPVDTRPDGPPAAVAAEDAPRRSIPRVIRRILDEEKELVDRSLLLAAELPDPHGKQRALDEVHALAAELARIEAPLDSAESDALDETVTQLIRLDTRIALLHDSLRTATNRTSALTVE